MLCIEYSVTPMLEGMENKTNTADADMQYTV